FPLPHKPSAQHHPLGNETFDIPHGDRGEHRQAARVVFAQIASGLIAITIRGPSREIRSAWGLVHGIGSARPAGSTYGGLALLPCCEPAIRGSPATAIIVGAPRIALRLSRFSDADDGGENHQDEQRKPHGYLLGKQRTT